MPTAVRLHFTEEDFADALDSADFKLEFWRGGIYAMAGGTPEHSALASNVMSLIQAKLPRGCRTMNSDMLLRIDAEDVTVFPDGQVVCGKVERYKFGHKIAIRNPGVIVEVTSPSTEDYDRGAKLAAYKTLRSVQAIWIVSHAEPRVSVIERHKRGWRQLEHRSGEHVTLAAPALTVDVDAIYGVLEGL